MALSSEIFPCFPVLFLFKMLHSFIRCATVVAAKENFIDYEKSSDSRVIVLYIPNHALLSSICNKKNRKKNEDRLK